MGDRGRVESQAGLNCRKARGRWIWTTNGKSHGFLKKTKKEKYQPVGTLEPLGVFSDPPVAELEFPANIDDHDGIRRYWKSLNDPQFLDEERDYDRRFVLAVHRVLFDRQMVKKVPFSHGGVHILEDCGSARHSFGNRSGGRYHTRYADFIAATRGRVEAVSVAVNRRRGGVRNRNVPITPYNSIPTFANVSTKQVPGASIMMAACQTSGHPTFSKRSLKPEPVSG